MKSAWHVFALLEAITAICGIIAFATDQKPLMAIAIGLGGLFAVVAYCYEPKQTK